MEVGITHTQFLRLTLREIGWYFDAWGLQQRVLNERVMLGAWWGEAFSRTPRLRSFSQYLKGLPDEDDASDEDKERAAVEALVPDMAKPEEQPQ